MPTMKYLFVGNRRFVLEEMLKANLSVVCALVIKDSYLERDVESLIIPYKIISSKEELLFHISLLDFDILISNGCPYILPVSNLNGKKYINIHPSYLPDLRGVDPTIGSILFCRNSGATCHIMNNSIDSGDIISQVKIPISDDLDVALLYQLSFVAEKMVFNQALLKDFEPYAVQVDNTDLIYYTRKDKDRYIDFLENNGIIFRKIKAFNVRSQGCVFYVNNCEFLVYEASRITNSFVVEYARDFISLQIIFVYEDAIVFKKDNEVIKFFKVIGDLTKIKSRDFLL